ncbi:fra a 1-associated protein [Argentina anserina]|uniref:fra a 1-associated protein n=1 Tax=Argentina anserina TaxID=57926 RepID=UPI0021762ABE|nr:fra a 1-associated protein [Potentilla anserina]
MGWVWRDDDNDGVNPSASDVIPRSDGDRYSTRKVVRTQCKTEEVEPGKFIRKCEKTEELLRDCVGRPVEVVQSNKEYTEDDVTDQVMKGSVSFGSSGNGAFNFPGLQSDIDEIERNVLGGLSRFFEAADGFFSSFGIPHIFDEGPSTSLPSPRREIPIDSPRQQEVFPKSNGTKSGEVDLSGLARDV